MTEAFWLDAFDFEERGSAEAVWKALGQPAKAAYLGNEPAARRRPGSRSTRSRSRRGSTGCAATRTPTRCARLEEATALGARGHRAAREAFAAGASELEIHQAFVRAVGCTEAQLPYTTIVALDEKGATLHYESKRSARERARAAARRRRAVAAATPATSRARRPARACDPRFVELVASGGRHRAGAGARRDARAALPRGAPRRPTRPSRACSRTCGSCASRRRRPSPRATPTPSSRTASATTSASRCTTWRAARPTRRARRRRRRRSTPTCATRARSSPATCSRSSPGIYFIPMLLRPLPLRARRVAPSTGTAIDALTPLGGVRVEDNVLVTARGPRNLTREQLAGLSSALRPRPRRASSATSSSGVPVVAAEEPAQPAVAVEDGGAEVVGERARPPPRKSRPSAAPSLRTSSPPVASRQCVKGGVVFWNGRPKRAQHLRRVVRGVEADRQEARAGGERRLRHERRVRGGEASSSGAGRSRASGSG